MRNQILSEASFLRAYFYFDLFRMFENIPLLKEQTRENVEQAHPDSIYAFIAKDLLYAIKNGNDIPYNQIAASDHGHTYKWAASSLLARVYLYYTGYYGKNDLVGEVTKDQALQNLENVIDNNEHALVDTFVHLWPAASKYYAAQQDKPIYENGYAGENNKEVIFGIKYTFLF